LTAAQHESAARYAGLAERAFIVSSFGKTFHVTGWKVGTVAAPAALTAEFRKVHQFNVFTVNTPVQHALASYLADPAPYLSLPAFYQRERDLFRSWSCKTPVSSCCPARAATSSASTSPRSATSPKPSSAEWLTREIGVAAIPLSAFYGNSFDQRVVRFCFAQKQTRPWTPRWRGSAACGRATRPGELCADQLRPGLVEPFDADRLRGAQFLGRGAHRQFLQPHPAELQHALIGRALALAGNRQ